MAGCHEMKVGEIYTCPDCGIELKVVKACDESDTSSDSCGCSSGDEHSFTCCGRELKKK